MHGLIWEKLINSFQNLQIGFHHNWLDFIGSLYHSLFLVTCWIETNLLLNLYSSFCGFFLACIQNAIRLEEKERSEKERLHQIMEEANHLGRNSTVRGRSTVRQTKTTTEKKKRWSTCIFCVNLSCFIYFCICCDVWWTKKILL